MRRLLLAAVLAALCFVPTAAAWTWPVARRRRPAVQLRSGASLCGGVPPRHRHRRRSRRDGGRTGDRGRHLRGHRALVREKHHDHHARRLRRHADAPRCAARRRGRRRLRGRSGGDDRVERRSRGHGAVRPSRHPPRSRRTGIRRSDRALAVATGSPGCSGAGSRPGRGPSGRRSDRGRRRPGGKPRRVTERITCRRRRPRFGRACHRDADGRRACGRSRCRPGPCVASARPAGRAGAAAACSDRSAACSVSRRPDAADRRRRDDRDAQAPIQVAATELEAVRRRRCRCRAVAPARCPTNAAGNGRSPRARLRASGSPRGSRRPAAVSVVAVAARSSPGRAVELRR